MMHPHTALSYINPGIGYGVVATRRIPRGSITWVLDPLDRAFPPEVAAALDPALREAVMTYCYRDNLGHYVLCWDHGRFVNHSFNPTCHMTAYNLQLAVRDIEPGEQLTDDYGYLNILEPFCPADEGGVRKVVYPDDPVRCHPDWDEALRAAFKCLPLVGQPLQAMLPPSTWEACLRIAEGEEEMASTLRLYFT